MADPACGNCKFYSSYGSREGRCRINPPILIVGSFSSQKGVWPMVTIYDWCGSYKREIEKKDTASDD